MHWECNSDGHIVTLIKGVIYLKIIPKNMKVKLPTTVRCNNTNKQKIFITKYYIAQT